MQHPPPVICLPLSFAVVYVTCILVLQCWAEIMEQLYEIVFLCNGLIPFTMFLSYIYTVQLIASNKHKDDICFVFVDVRLELRLSSCTPLHAKLQFYENCLVKIMHLALQCKGFNLSYYNQECDSTQYIPWYVACSEALLNMNRDFCCI